MTCETLLLSDNVTGEANTRLLSIKVAQEFLAAADCKAIREIIKENYGMALPLVIRKVVELGSDKLHEHYKSIVDTFMENYPELLPDYCWYMAILALADALLNSVWANDDAFDEAMICAKEIFKPLPTINELSDTALEKEFGDSFIAQNQSRFVGGNVELDKM